MQGEFSRNTFNVLNHYSRVLRQQGRLDTDADWNEQTSIILHFLRTLGRDIIGPHGGPVAECGFEIITHEDGVTLDRGELRKTLSDNSPSKLDFVIGEGRYWVDGILCENDEPILYSSQSNLFDLPLLDVEKKGPFLIYLDVYEHHLTYIEDDNMREVALGGPDTATRAKLVWHVRAEQSIESFNYHKKSTHPSVPELMNLWQPKNRGRLRARVKDSDDGERDPHLISPEPQNRDLGNQLYRVEIQRGGGLGRATLKWSRDNAAVIFPIEHIQTPQGQNITLGHLGRDIRSGLEVGNWVEVVGDGYVILKNDQDTTEPHPLLKIVGINKEKRQVTIEPSVKVDQGRYKHLSLRRWDQTRGASKGGGTELLDGAIQIIEGNGDNGWISLEKGLEIQFLKTDTNQQDAYYGTGNYWQIAVRASTGDVDASSKKEGGRPPDGIEHHYAPLAVISKSKDMNTQVDDYRMFFGGLALPEKT